MIKASDEGVPSPHVACTVEMSNLAQEYEVAVIDEIQVSTRAFMRRVGNFLKGSLFFETHSYHKLKTFLFKSFRQCF